MLLVSEREAGEVEQRVARGRPGPVDHGEAGPIAYVAEWSVRP